MSLRNFERNKGFQFSTFLFVNANIKALDLFKFKSNIFKYFSMAYMSHRLSYEFFKHKC